MTDTHEIEDAVAVDFVRNSGLTVNLADGYSGAAEYHGTLCRRLRDAGCESDPSVIINRAPLTPRRTGPGGPVVLTPSEVSR